VKLWDTEIAAHTRTVLELTQEKSSRWASSSIIFPELLDRKVSTVEHFLNIARGNFCKVSRVPHGVAVYRNSTKCSLKIISTLELNFRKPGNELKGG
jgi:hypothetical protein